MSFRAVRTAIGQHFVQLHGLRRELRGDPRGVCTLPPRHRIVRARPCNATPPGHRPIERVHAALCIGPWWCRAALTCCVSVCLPAHSEQGQCHACSLPHFISSSAAQCSDHAVRGVHVLTSLVCRRRARAAARTIRRGASALGVLRAFDEPVILVGRDRVAGTVGFDLGEASAMCVSRHSVVSMRIIPGLNDHLLARRFAAGDLLQCGIVVDAASRDTWTLLDLSWPWGAVGRNSARLACRQRGKARHSPCAELPHDVSSLKSTLMFGCLPQYVPGRGKHCCVSVCEPGRQRLLPLLLQGC